MGSNARPLVILHLKDFFSGIGIGVVGAGLFWEMHSKTPGALTVQLILVGAGIAVLGMVLNVLAVLFRWESF